MATPNRPLTFPLTGTLAHPLCTFGRWPGDSAPFDPATLFAAGEKGWWYDPSDLSTLFQDAAGTTPVTATGQPVGRMNDKSGNGEYIVQRTDASRPILRQDASGNYYLEGTVSSRMVTQTLSGANREITMGGASAACWFTATHWTAGSYCFEYGASSSGRTTLQTNPTHTHVVQSGSVSTTLGAGNISYGTTYVTSLIADLSLAADTQAAFDIRRNGTGVTFTGANLSAGTYSNAVLYLLSSQGGSGNLQGRFYGIIVRAASCTADEIAGVEGWLADKSGVTL